MRSENNLYKLVNVLRYYGEDDYGLCQVDLPMHFIHAVLDNSDSLIGTVGEIMDSIPELSSSTLHLLFPLGHRIICVYAKLDEKFFEECSTKGIFVRGSSASIQMKIFSFMCNEVRADGWTEKSDTISDQNIQDDSKTNKVYTLRKLIYIIGMTYLLYCSSLGTQFFLHDLLEKRNFWYYPFAATYRISLVVIMLALEKLGWYKEQLNNRIVILSMVLGMLTLGILNILR